MKYMPTDKEWKESEDRRREEAIKEAINKLEQSVKTCDRNAIILAHEATYAVDAVHLNSTNHSITSEGLALVSKIRSLANNFADKCSCIKK
jgi:hypothetical protein